MWEVRRTWHMAFLLDAVFHLVRIALTYRANKHKHNMALNAIEIARFLSLFLKNHDTDHHKRNVHMLSNPTNFYELRQQIVQLAIIFLLLV